jgi:hypothetical protein
MADETTFFQGGDITVTNARFIVGAQTFAMRGITSVEGVETPARRTWPMVMGLFGLMMTAAGFGDAGSVVFGIFGILVTAAGIWLAFRQKATFSVVLRTAGGEVTAYQSMSRDHIAEIIQALNQAIISHG